MAMSMWGPSCCFHDYPMAIHRIPQMMTMADRLFDSMDQMLQVPSQWLNQALTDPALQQLGNTTEIMNNDNQFKINLDVKDFEPEHLNVKCVKDRFLVIEGKKEEEKDVNGVKEKFFKEFACTFVIPKGVQVGELKSSMSDDGMLSIEAPKKALPPTQEERTIAIEHEK